jgi:hypothetical protein
MPPTLAQSKNLTWTDTLVSLVFDEAHKLQVDQANIRARQCLPTHITYLPSARSRRTFTARVHPN